MVPARAHTVSLSHTRAHTRADRPKHTAQLRTLKQAAPAIPSSLLHQAPADRFAGANRHMSA